MKDYEMNAAENVSKIEYPFIGEIRKDGSLHIRKRTVAEDYVSEKGISSLIEMVR